MNKEKSCGKMRHVTEFFFSFLGKIVQLAAALSLNQLHFKVENSVRRNDSSSSSGTISELGRNKKSPLASDLHGWEILCFVGKEPK